MFQSDEVDALNRFERELLELYGKDAEPMDTPQCNDLCIVQEENKWFRAQVIDVVMEGQIYIVFLVDYGIEISVRYDKIYVLKEFHALVAPFIFKCKMCDFNPYASNESIESEDLCHLEKMRNLDLDSDNISVEAEEHVSSWLPPIPIPPAARGVVTHVNKKGTIFFMVAQNCGTAAEISNEIKNIINNASPSVPSDWKVNQPCFAMFHDGEYYRAVINKINIDESCQVFNWFDFGNKSRPTFDDAVCRELLEKSSLFFILQIRFVDYGNEMKTELFNLHRATDFGGVPILANRVYISSLCIKNEELSASVLKEFENQMIERVVNINIDNINLQNLEIFPCSINVEHLNCDFTQWLAQNGIGFGIGLNKNDKILYV